MELVEEQADAGSLHWVNTIQLMIEDSSCQRGKLLGLHQVELQL